MGNELIDTADSYLEYQDKPKEIPLELPADYDSMDTLNPNPSIRDQEYLQHSSLWSHQHITNNDKVNDRQRIKPGSVKNIKNEKENALPAYCTPPNPCPVGYTSKWFNILKWLISILHICIFFYTFLNLFYCKIL